MFAFLNTTSLYTACVCCTQSRFVLYIFVRALSFGDNFMHSPTLVL